MLIFENSGICKCNVRLLYLFFIYNWHIYYIMRKHVTYRQVQATQQMDRAMGHIYISLFSGISREILEIPHTQLL